MFKSLLPWKQTKTKVMVPEQIMENDQVLQEQKLVPCSTCGRTFLPVPLKKHAPVCEKNAQKKRKVFDSLKQRVEGTDLAQFHQKTYLKKTDTTPKTAEKSKKKWEESHQKLVETIRTAKGASKEMSPIKKPQLAPASTLNERCPFCDRQFGPKAFDRHVEWCKEHQTRVQRSPANVLLAKERLEARTKYKVPPLSKPKRTTIKEKYSTTNINRTESVCSVKSTPNNALKREPSIRKPRSVLDLGRKVETPTKKANEKKNDKSTRKKYCPQREKINSRHNENLDSITVAPVKITTKKLVTWRDISEQNEEESVIVVYENSNVFGKSDSPNFIKELKEILSDSENPPSEKKSTISISPKSKSTPEFTNESAFNFLGVTDKIRPLSSGVEEENDVETLYVTNLSSEEILTDSYNKSDEELTKLLSEESCQSFKPVSSSYEQVKAVSSNDLDSLCLSDEDECQSSSLSDLLSSDEEPVKPVLFNGESFKPDEEPVKVVLSNDEGVKLDMEASEHVSSSECLSDEDAQASSTFTRYESEDKPVSSSDCQSVCLSDELDKPKIDNDLSITDIEEDLEKSSEDLLAENFKSTLSISTNGEKDFSLKIPCYYRFGKENVTCDYEVPKKRRKLNTTFVVDTPKVVKKNCSLPQIIQKDDDKHENDKIPLKDNGNRKSVFFQARFQKERKNLQIKKDISGVFLNYQSGGTGATRSKSKTKNALFEPVGNSKQKQEALVKKGKTSSKKVSQEEPDDEIIDLTIKPDDLFSVDDKMYAEYKIYEEMYLKEKEQSANSKKKSKNSVKSYGIELMREDQSPTNKTSDDSAYGSLNRTSPKPVKLSNIQRKRMDSASSSGSENFPNPPVFNNQQRMSKFCHECGNKYPLTTAKFCVECGVKRLIL